MSVSENRFQSIPMRELLQEQARLTREMEQVQRKLQSVCTHLFPTGASARQVYVDGDGCIICRSNL